MMRQTSQTPRQRVLAFLATYREASNDADIEVRIGTTDTSPAIMVSLCGCEHYFLTEEARMIADIAEKAMAQYPNDPESASLPNMILALRAGADKADAEFAAQQEPSQ
jgi:hypothetical protein